MKKWAIKSSKGGVGKSILSLNLAAALNLMGKRVLLIDLDANTSSLSQRLAGKEKGLLHKVDGKKIELITTKEGFSFLPIGKEKGSTSVSKAVLKKVLKEFENQFDVLIMDNPPEMSELSIASLKNSDFVLIPTYPDILSMDGTALTMKRCEKLGVKVKIAFNRVTRTRLSRLVMEQLSERFPKIVLQNYVKQRSCYAESLSFGVSAVKKDGLAKMDFRDLAEELWRVRLRQS